MSEKVGSGNVRISHRKRPLSCQVVRSWKRRNWEILVGSDCLIKVRVPLGMKSAQITQLLNLKRDWITRTLAQYKANPPQIRTPSYSTNSTLPYLGRNYPLLIQRGQAGRRDRLVLKGGSFVAYASGTGQIKKTTRQLFESWLEKRSGPIFTRKILKFSKIMGIRRVPRLNVKRLAGRWGFVSDDNRTIHLNYNLLKAPSGVIDYIVVHELCHLFVEGHSREFWDRVRGVIPSYEKKKRWLEINSHKMLM